MDETPNGNFSYTQNIVQSFAAQGTPIDILQVSVLIPCCPYVYISYALFFLQVGNEINNGFLWPVGEVSVNGLNPVSQMLHSAINGAKSVGSPKIMLHLANGWDWSDLDFWFSGIFVPGELSASQVDVVGVSFYPFYDAGATLSALNSSLINLVGLLNKDIVVAETDWPVSCSGVALTEPSIPVSTTGQQIWIQDIKSVLDGLPNGRGKGICK